MVTVIAAFNPSFATEELMHSAKLPPIDNRRENEKKL